MNHPSGRASGRPAKRFISGFLSRLARDKAGNTLMLTAAFVIPLAALAGSAVDMSRLYLVKVRLQQACDAGVLAGRKVMTQTTGTTLDTASENAAQAFFKNNLPSGWMGTTGRTFTTGRESDGQVTGTAQVTIPMAIMGMFGAGPMTQTATCSARLDIGDSDIMFVLDTTGSMACYTDSGCSSVSTWTREDGSTGYYRNEEPTTYDGSGKIVKQAKIAALRDAVKLFRTTLESNKPAAAHIRYGFVTYSSATNVGAVIRTKSSNYLVDSAVYPSRELATNASGAFNPADVTSKGKVVNAAGTVMTSLKLNENPKTDSTKSYYIALGEFNQGDLNYGSTPTAVTTTSITQPDCMAKETRRFGSGTTDQPTGTWPTDGTVVTRTLPVWTSGSGGTCKTYAWTVKPVWRYTEVTRDVSSFKTGSSVNDPTKLTKPATKWEGCIVERQMTPATASTTYDPKNLPADMNPDTMPTTDALKWRPMWPETVYYRTNASDMYYIGGNVSSASSDAPSSAASAADGTDLMGKAVGDLFYACGSPAQTLQEMSAADFDSYLGTPTSGDFRAFGYTFHDIGMIWGLRLISPDGPWASTTSAWPGNNEPNRYIVFMTDGDMLANKESYTMYGLNSVEAGIAAVNATSNTIHTNRFLAVCNAAKQKNIIVFVVQFDIGATPSADMTSCATDTYAYAAQTPAQLQTAFSRIALEITRLRLAR